MIDRAKFFADPNVLQLFKGNYSESQANGIECLFLEWENRDLTDLRWLAYILATAYHETGRRMQPIDELGGHAYFMDLYDVSGSYPDRARANGNVNVGDGALFHGRGFPQLTWRNNYRKMATILTKPKFGVDIEQRPDDAKRLDIAIAIMFEGMLRAESHFGDFTGKALEDYFNATTDDPVNARRVVNGLDKAHEIAGYHRIFLKALS